MSNETKVPAIPHSADPAVKALKEALEVRLGRRGDTLDRAITVRELYENGVINLSGMPTIPVNKMRPIQPIDTTKDTSIPPAPTNVTAAGAFVGILVSWDKPARQDLIAEIWRNTVDDRTSAVLSGVAQGFIFSDLVGHGKTYYYWVRYVSEAGTIGPFNAVDGVQGVTSKSVTAVMEDLNDAIGETQLDVTLKAEIAKITPLAGLQETAETIEMLLGQAQSGSSAVEILRDTINNELSTLSVEWSGLDGTEGLQLEIDQLIVDAGLLKVAITSKIDAETVTWSGDGTTAGLNAEITTAVGDAANFKTGVIGTVDNKTTEWQGADGSGGIKAGIETELTTASDFKTGVNTHVNAQVITWEGSDGFGGIKSQIATELTTASDLKLGIVTQTDADAITWEGSDGNGGIKAELTTELSTATSLKTGINTTTSSKQMDWEGSDGNGGVKAGMQEEYNTAVNLKTGIKSETDSKELSWQGADGNGGVKATLSTNLTNAVSLKDGIAGELDSKTLSWEGDADNNGTKAELALEYQSAVNLKAGIKTESDAKSLSWEGADGTGGIKAGITSNLTEASNLKSGIQGTTDTKTITWEGTDGNGGIKAGITSAISTANSLKSGIISTTTTKESTWQGTDGNGGIKAGISAAIDDATDLKSGIATHTNTENLTWEGTDGNGGVKAQLATSITNVTTLKDGINSETTSKNLSWEGTDGNGGVKAALSTSYDNAANLKAGIAAEVSTKTTSWQGSDGNGGIKADITTYLGDATNLKTGVSTFVDTETQTWEGPTGSGGVKAEITTALTEATNLKIGMNTTKDEKYLAWHGGTDANGNAVTGIKNEILQVEEFFADLPANYISDIETLQATFGDGEDLSTVITQQGQIIDDVKTQQFVKTDVNGHVAGYGLYNSTDYSEFAIKADVFKIANGTSSTQPFIVVTGAGLTVVSPTQQYADTTEAWRDDNFPEAKWFAAGTYIDTALIADASIDVAKIGNLSVDFANVTGSLTASQINAISLSADQISGGAINGITITGSRINSGSAYMEDGLIEGAVIKGAYILETNSASATEAGDPHYGYRTGVLENVTDTGTTYVKSVNKIRPYNFHLTSIPPAGPNYDNNYFRYRREDICALTPPEVALKFYWSGSAHQVSGSNFSQNFFTVQLRMYEGTTVTDTESCTFSGTTNWGGGGSNGVLTNKTYTENVGGFVFTFTTHYRTWGHESNYSGYYDLIADAQWVTFTVTPPATYDFDTATAIGWGFDATVTCHRGSSSQLELSVYDVADNDYI